MDTTTTPTSVAAESAEPGPARKRLLQIDRIRIWDGVTFD